MSGGGDTAAGRDATGRRVTYCLIPADLADPLHDLLHRHFREDPAVEVVVERRGAERRSRADRRAGKAEAPKGTERRLVRSTTGRRIGERRAAQVPAEAPELPRRARRHAARLSFVERVEPPSEQAEDRDTARVVARIQAGDREAFGVIYTRYFERVYTYVRAVVPTKQDAEDVTQEAFAKLLEAIPRYERREQPFRAWLFRVVRNATVDHLARQGRLEPMEPEELDAIRDAREPDATEPQELTALDWITDQDLMIFVERLPLAQRQVLVLRFVFGMKTNEIAQTLGRSRTSVSTLQYRALEFLGERLTAVGRAPATNERGGNKMKTWGTAANVVRARRFALWD